MIIIIIIMTGERRERGRERGTIRKERGGGQGKMVKLVGHYV